MGPVQSGSDQKFVIDLGRQVEEIPDEGNPMTYLTIDLLQRIKEQQAKLAPAAAEQGPKGK